MNVKPTVTNPQLQSIIDVIYKGQNAKGHIGNGTIMDAVRNELITGKPTKGVYHSKKARVTVNELKKQISNGNLDDHDKRMARALIRNIKKALSGN